MALPKHYLFSESEQDVSHFGFILAHPARLQIIELLATYGVLETEQIMGYLPLAQSTVSDHLRYLQRAQLIRIRATPFGTSGYGLIRENYEANCELLGHFLNRTRSRSAA